MNMLVVKECLISKHNKVIEWIMDIRLLGYTV